MTSNEKNCKRLNILFRINHFKRSKENFKAGTKDFSVFISICTALNLIFNCVKWNLFIYLSVLTFLTFSPCFYSL